MRSVVGMTHSLRSDLWWAIPFRILLDQFRDTLWMPHDQASPSQTHRCPGACGSRQSDHVIIFDQSQGAPINIGTYHIQPAGVHGLCFGYCFSGPLPLRSLILGHLSRVHFGDSLIVRFYSEIDHTYLSIEAQCVSHHYPRWTATGIMLLRERVHPLTSIIPKHYPVVGWYGTEVSFFKKLIGWR